MSANFIMACHIAGVYDVNRSTTLPADDYGIVKEWADSVAALRLNGVIFHNNFSDETCQKYQNEYVRFVKITHNPQYNPNVYRYLVYQDFLQKETNNIENVFFTDVADVVVVNNPFEQPLFLENKHALFCGDEPQILHNEWMQAHAAHLRNKIADYADYEAQFSTEPLLNCGIFGGNSAVIQPFIKKICNIHQQHNHDNKTAYTGDMGAFNYLVRTQFNAHLHHGAPVNTIFKAYQNQRTDCWFRHK
jgi:hypothetical protein